MDSNVYRQPRVRLLAGLILSATTALAAAAPAQVWHYALHDGSFLTDDCPICGRPTIDQPMRGDFELRLLQQGPLFTEYVVEHIQFSAGSAAGRLYTVRGNGTYRIGGEVAM